MAAGLAMAFAGVGCSDDEPATGSGSHNWNIDGNEIVNIKPERYKLLRNPMSGWVLYAGLGDGLSDTFWDDYDNFPSAVGPVKVSDYANTLFIRGAWSDFNPEPGKYVWNEGQLNTKPAKRFKMLVDGAKERGLKLAFCVRQPGQALLLHSAVRHRRRSQGFLYRYRQCDRMVAVCRRPCVPAEI